MARSSVDVDLRRFIGIPYSDKGRSFEGCDCWGLAYLFYREVMGIEVPTYVNLYSSANDSASAQLAVIIGRRQWQKIEDVQFGDIIIFQLASYMCHAAVYVEGGEFLHTLTGRNSSLDRLSSFVWAKSRKEGYRWQKT